MMSNRTKTVGVVSLAVCIAGIALLVSTFYLIDQKDAELTDFVHVRATEKAEEQGLRSLVQLAEDTQSERNELHTYLLTEEGVVDFLTLIETVAEEQAIVFEASSLVVREIENSDSFIHLALTADVSGSLDRLIHMLKLFETLSYQVVVEDVVLNRLEGGVRWRGVYTMRITQQKNHD